MKNMKDFDKKIESFNRSLNKQKNNSKKFSMKERPIIRLASEFVSGIFAGIVLGLIIDHFFETKPWGLVFCFILGICSGFYNIFRVIKKI